MIFGNLHEVRKIIQEENDILLKQIVEIINASLRCKDGGKVVLRSAEEIKEIEKRQ